MKGSLRHARSEALAAQALPPKDAALPLPRRKPSISELRLPRHRDETTALAPPVEIYPAESVESLRSGIKEANRVN
jgi:hypothetical protein